MSTWATFERYDFERAEAALRSVATADVQAIVGVGFVGLFEANEMAEEALFTPSPTPGAPRIFPRFGIEYSSVDATFDGAVDRLGTVELHLFGQYGAPQVLLGDAARLYLEALLAAGSADTVAFIEAVPPVSLETAEGWMRRRYGVRFHGVG